jgi:hypothetical protein
MFLHSTILCQGVKSGSAIQVMLCWEHVAKAYEYLMGYREAFARQHYLDSTTYNTTHPSAFCRIRVNKLTTPRAVRRLEQLGFQVTLAPPLQALT